MSIYEYDYDEHMRMERADSYADGLREGKLEGRLEGRLEGKQESLHLILFMIQDGLSDSIHRLASDADFYQQMLEKYASQPAIVK